MEMRRILAMIAALLLCLAAVTAGAEVTAKNTEKDGKLLTNGGRVLGVTAVADTLEQAIDGAYGKVKTIHFDNAFYHNDIGAKALKAGRN